MNIELVLLNDDRISLISDKPLSDIVAHVEFYREQRLFMLVFDNEENGDSLMECEVSEKFIPHIEKSPNVTICSHFPNHGPLIYKVPLIKVGDLYRDVA